MVKTLGIGTDKIENFDFRAMHILSRLEAAEEVLTKAIPGIDKFKDYLATFDSDDKVVFGNIWDYELPLFDKAIKDKDYLKKNFTLVPHDLTKKVLRV